MPTDPPPLIQDPTEQRVPAVLARKDDQTKFDFHKVFAAIGVILTAAIIIIGGMWIAIDQLNRRVDDLQDDLVIATRKTSTTAPTATSSAKTATKSATASAK